MRSAAGTGLSGRRWERELSVRHGDAECSKGRSAGKAKESGRSISMAYHGTIPHRMLGVNGQIQGATVSVPDHQRRLHSLEMTSTSSLDDTGDVVTMFAS